MAYEMPEARPTAKNWFYTRRGQQQGPVSWSRLQALAGQGWLTAEDLIWHSDLPDWIPAGEVPGLFATGRVLRMLRQVNGTFTRLTNCRRQQRGQHSPVAVQPSRSVSPTSPAISTCEEVASAQTLPHKSAVGILGGLKTKEVPINEQPHFIERTKFRHLLAILGALLITLGGIFLLVRPTAFAWSFLAMGVPLVFFCLLPEFILTACAAGMAIGRFLMIVVAEFHSARRRDQAQQDEGLREAASRRQGGAAVESGRSKHGGSESKLYPGMITRYQHDSLRGLVAVYEPAIKLWSRPVAGVLSICPGLGHVYKRQYLGGLIWCGCVFVAYSTHVLAGVVLHGLCVAAGASGVNWSKAANRVYRE